MAENKEKKVLNVPNLRFPEFEGEWEKKRLGDFTERVKRKNKYNLSKLPLTISAKYGLVDQITFFNKIVASTDMSNYYLLKKGEFAYNKSYSNDYPWGAIKRLDNYEQGVLSALYICFTTQDNVESDFILQYFESPKWHKSVSEIAVEGARNHGLLNISVQDFFQTYHYVPKEKKEQTKIATLLHLIDERISTQNKIIEDLKKLKCAIIEKHYRQAKLHKYKICDLGVPFSVGSLSKEDLSEKGHECILYGELFTTYDCVINEIKSHTNKIANMTLSQKRDLLFPSSTTVDAVSLISPSVIDIPNVVLGGDMFGIHIDKKFNAYYLSYYINIITRKKLAIYAKGSTIIHLHYKDIAKAQLLLPDLCEQDRIAKCMMAEDEKIKVEEQLMTKLEEQKQYLLRQMFI